MTHATFFIANDSEISNVTSLEELLDLIVTNGYSPDFDFDAVSSLSSLILQKEIEILEEYNGKRVEGAEIFRCCDEFIEKAVEYKYEEYDDLAYTWRETYWEPVKKYSGMGIWANLYQLLTISKQAMKTDKKIFVLKENQ